MTNGTKSEFTSHCRIAAKTNFLMLLLCPARFAHARYSSRMIDRFLNWGDHGKPKSGRIKGRCQPLLVCAQAMLTICTVRKNVFAFTVMSRSLVSLVCNKFEQGPFSFIELLFYTVGLLTFPFRLGLHLGFSICNEAEQYGGPQLSHQIQIAHIKYKLLTSNTNCSHQKQD